LKDLFVEQRGSGNPIVLIHGFPMNHHVWNHFATDLSKEFLVFTPDLPGFGKSKILTTPFSIDDVAQRLIEWLDNEKQKKSVIIGHSLGGYVTLAIAAKRPDLLAGLGLFHSTALADSIEKKESRTKVIEFVEKNGAPAFTSNFIQPLFADADHAGIEMVRNIAVQSSAEAITGYTLAMRDRPGRERLLESFDKPILFIAGEKDGGIPVKSIRYQASIARHPYLHILKSVAHMGMFENQSLTLEIVRSFASNCTR